MNKGKRFMLIMLSIVMFLGNIPIESMAVNLTTTPEGYDVRDDVVLVNEKNTAEALMKSGKYKGSLDDNIFGLAGNFFLTGFESVKIEGHAHGNILTKELFNNTNFGSNFPKEFTYIQEKISGQNGDLVKTSDAVLVLGKDIPVSYDANMWNINGNKINSPQHNGSYNLWQDDTEKFIDLDKVENEMRTLSKDLSKLDPTDGIEFVADQNELNGIGMNGVQKAMVLPNTGQDMFVYTTDIDSLGSQKLGITKLTSRDQTVVLNIDANGKSSINLPSIVYKYNGNMSENEEISSASNGNIIVNIFDSKKSDGIFTGKVTTGTNNNIFLLVPGGDIKISKQFNGIAIGQNIENSGTEIHRDKPTTPPRERKINIPVSKFWIVKDESTIADKVVEVKLLENGEFKGKILKLTKANNWKGEFKNLPVKDEAGKDIVYTIEEIDVLGFDKGHGGNQDDGFMLINSERPVLPPEKVKINIPVNKIWIVEDESTIQDKTVEVKLLENGEFKGKTIKLTKANGWKDEFKNLPVKDEAGKDIVYTIEEIDIPGFDKGHGVNPEGGFTLINSERPILPPEEVKINIPVTKVWENTNGEEANKEVKVTLLADGKEIKELVLKGPNWKGSFESLPKYKEGTDNLIKYTIKELPIEGYTVDIAKNEKNGFVVTNTKTEEPVEKIEIPVSKKWVDENEKDISGDIKVEKVIIQLFEEGKEGVIKTLELTKENDWKGTFKDLPKYKEGTKEEIKYVVKEVKIDGYNMVISGGIEEGFVVTNTKTEEPVEFMAMSIEKNWEDEKGNQLDKILDADGNKIEKIILELTSSETGSEVTSITLEAANKWKFENDKLPKIDKVTGNKIKYSLKEVSKIKGFTLKEIKDNSDEVKFDFDLVNKRDVPVEIINIPVNKMWLVKDESKIADKVEVKLLENGVFNNKTLELTKANNWKDEFKDLPVKDASGKDIAYTIEEIDIPGFDKGIGGNQETGFTLINAERPVDPPIELRNIPVEKLWKVKDEETIKDKVVEVKLLENGVFNNKTLELTKANNWKGEFKDLPVKNIDGENIVYTIKEIDIPGFDKGHGGNQEVGFTLINAERPVDPPIELRNIPVQKIWKVKDESKIAGKVEVKLLEKGVFNNKTLELTKANNWKGEFKDLPVKNTDGEDIVYTIEEIDIPGFDKGMGGNQETGFTLINAERPVDPPVELRNIPVRKMWKVKDETKVAGKVVEVKLLENGIFNGKTLKLTKGNDWKAEFKNLPIRDLAGKHIKYTVEEVSIPGFDKGIGGNQEQGFVLINAEKPIKPDEPDPGKPIEPGEPRLDIRVSKRWEDKSGKLIDGKDVDKIIEVKLYANGVEIDSIKLDKAKGWIHVFKDLPKKNKNGDTIEYRVEEGYLPGYKAEVKENALGFEITNREKPDNPKPIKPIGPDPVKPIKPVEPVTPTIPVGPNPEKPIKPVKPTEPIEKTPKGKNPNPQTYRGGILLTGLELVSILALILYLRKRMNKYPAK